MPEFEGRVVVVTGGGSGIGAAAAIAFAREGARVAICGRTPEKLRETASHAGDIRGEIVPMQADISRASDVERLYGDVADRWGRLDSVFAHAGVNGVWTPIEKLAPEEWAKTIAINLNGAFHTVKYAVPMLKRAGGGSIVITSSINGTTKFSDLGATAYCASKAGLVAFAKLLALELAEHRIRVNAVCPGSIATRVGDHTEKRDTEATGEYAEYRRGGIPLTGGEAGTAEQVADLVLFLASDRAGHITGSPVWIDGGQSLIQ